MKEHREAPWDIRERAFEHGLRAIRLFRYPEDKRDRAGWIVAKQYLRATTSVGANLEEALHGESRSDFIHKYGIAQKEARESLYWLRLLTESETLPRDRVQPLIKETEEIILIVNSQGEAETEARESSICRRKGSGGGFFDP